MKFIETLRENTRVSSVWLCRAKSTHLTKTGKEYESVTLQDKTGSVDGKIWDPGNPGIGDFDAPDYVAVDADVQLFNGSLQLNIRRIRKADESEYIPADYLPTSDKDNDVMFSELLEEIAGVKDPYLSRLLERFFLKDPAFVRKFRESSAAKSVHHGFMGGLLEHTLSVAKLCEYYCTAYPAREMAGLHVDRLIRVSVGGLALGNLPTGKTRELSAFPENSYTDEGQLLGHIVIGCEMLAEKIREIPGFPEKKAAELRHCIIAHHGEYEFGSPKKPALIEAMALNLADNTDAKMETFREILEAVRLPGLKAEGIFTHFSDSDGSEEYTMMQFNRFLDSNLRKTSE